VLLEASRAQTGFGWQFVSSNAVVTVLKGFFLYFLYPLKGKRLVLVLVPVFVLALQLLSLHF